MLNKELSHFSESKSGNQISEYICTTFLGKLLAIRNIFDQGIDITRINLFDAYVFYLIFKDKQQDIDVPIYSPTAPTTNTSEVEHLNSSFTSNDQQNLRKHEKRDANDAISNSKPSYSIEEVIGWKFYLKFVDMYNYI